MVFATLHMVTTWLTQIGLEMVTREGAVLTVHNPTSTFERASYGIPILFPELSAWALPCTEPLGLLCVSGCSKPSTSAGTRGPKPPARQARDELRREEGISPLAKFTASPGDKARLHLPSHL
jgi:hypothetical protein